MLSRAATMQILEKLGQNDSNEGDNQEYKKFIMQDSFQSDYSYEESSESGVSDKNEEQKSSSSKY